MLNPEKVVPNEAKFSDQYSGLSVRWGGPNKFKLSPRKNCVEVLMRPKCFWY